MSDRREATPGGGDAAVSPAPIAARRSSPPNGWWGMALFLGAEVTLFGTLMATYFYLDFDARRWPPAGIAPPSVLAPLLATALLLATTVPAGLAARWAAQRRPGRVIAMLLLAALVQSAYLAVQILLFRHDYNLFTPQSSAYGSIYFTLLAAHHAHVLLGVLLDLGVAFSVAVRGLTGYWMIAVRNVALYWYVVSALAVLVVLTQLSPSL